MRRPLLMSFTVCLLGLTACACNSYAATGMEVLVQKLEEKGNLTQYEAHTILEETRRELANSIAEAKADTAPEWTQIISINGDLRYRNQLDWQDNDNNETRWRQRVRARLGITGKVNEDVKAGIRLVTGNDNPTSTNQTLGDFFGSKSFMLDLAYIEYTPGFLGDHVTLEGGIFDNPFYYTEMLWDTDVSFGGAAILASINTGEIPFLAGVSLPSTDIFGTAGQFPLDEISTTWGDPMLWGVQGGINTEILNGVNLKSALTFYDYENVIRYVENHSQGGNVRALEAGFGEGFRIIDIPSEIGIKDPLRFVGVESGENPLIPYLKIYGDYANNLATGEGDNAWMAGAAIGHKKVSKPKQWQLAYDYRDIGSNSQVDVFPDADFYGTGTGAYGHNVRLLYGIAKNTTIGAEWYLAYRKAINSGFAFNEDRTRSLLQLDAQVKF